MTATLVIGQRASIVLDVTEELIDRFAALSTDDNPLHVDAAFARAAGFADRVAHGVLSVSALSALIGTKLPGTGALWRRLQVDWVRPVFPGDRVTITAEVVRASAAHGSVVLRVQGENQKQLEVLRGEAVVGALGADEAAPVASAPRAPSVVAGTTSASERPVLVTGGSRGIGRSIAIALGRMGHPVAVGYHTARSEAEQVVAQIIELGARAVAVPLDLERDDGLLEGLTAAAQSLGPVVGLVHGATPPVAPVALAELAPGELRRFWQVYVGCLLGGLQQLRGDIERAKWGRLVFLGTSYQIGAPPPKMLAYVSAKAALDGLMRSLAIELGPLGATSNMIAPGMVKTDLNRHVSARALLTEAQRTPARRLAEPEDAAAVTAFLFGDGGGFVNGACVPITGGLVIP